MKQGLSNDQQSLIYLNLKEGKIVTKEKDSMVTYASITGKITEMQFVEDEYNGKKYEKAKVFITADNKQYCLQMRTESGYFRGLCNSLKSGKPTELVTLSPNSKNVNGKPVTTIFVKQMEKWLKHYHTAEDKGDMPELIKVEFKGNVHYDNSDQINYWKNWATKTFANGGKPNTFIENEEEVPF
jgi:hypothetical protein